MLNITDILETIGMIREENLDIRTITMGISLLDCVSEDENRLCEKVYDKITTTAKDLVSVGCDIENNGTLDFVFGTYIYNVLILYTIYYIFCVSFCNVYARCLLNSVKECV